jgi:FkbM family methyltransferase
MYTPTSGQQMKNDKFKEFKNLSSDEKIKEWIAKSYEECKASYPLPNMGGIAFDIGANVGGFCLHAHKNFHRIYAFEPFKKNFNVISNVIAQLEIKNVFPWNIAVYSDSGKTLPLLGRSDTFVSGDISVVTDEGNDSLYEMGEECKTISLKDAMDSLNVHMIDYLKMDCEGAEYAILENFPDYDKIYWICIELHGNSTPPDYGENKRRAFLLKMFKHYYFIETNQKGTFSFSELIEQGEKTGPEGFINSGSVLMINRKIWNEKK